MFENNGYSIRGYIDRGKFVINLFCSFIGQSVHPVGGEWMGYRRWRRGINILASCKFHIIREHENMVQHPSNNISILRTILHEYTL